MLLPDLFGNTTQAESTHVRRDGVVIIATYKAGHRCNSLCMYATGNQCECSCNGRNHGLGNLPLEEN